MKKKLIALVCALALAVGLAGCSLIYIMFYYLKSGHCRDIPCNSP